MSDGFADSVAVLDEPAVIDVAGVGYEIPAGVQLAEGGLFGFDFALADSEDAGCVLFALSVPFIEGLEDVTVADLEDVAEEIYGDVASDPDATSVLTAFWSGAYDFLGFPTIGVEGQAADEDGTEIYFCVTASATSEGVSVLFMMQPADETFADYVLGSAFATAEPLAASGSAAGLASGALSGGASEPGFVVGLPAA